MNNKFIYILNQRFPTEKGYGLQVARMCDAFVQSGIDIELVIPKRINNIKDDPYTYYDMDKRVVVTTLPAYDFYLPSFLNRFANIIKNALSARKLVKYVKDKDVTIYTREEIVAYIANKNKKKVILELHKFYDNRIRLYKKLNKAGIKVVTISQGLKDALIGIGYDSNRILVAHDGVDIDRFDIPQTKQEARKQLDLPQDKKLVIYTGHLYDWKGVDTLIESAKYLNNDTLIVLVGGTDADIEKYKQIIIDKSLEDKIKLVGHKPYEDMPLYTRSADVLVLPNSGKEAVSNLYTSPLKLFTYMASRVPVVASDLPSIREVLDDDMTYFVKPDDPQALLSQGIQKAFEDKGSKSESAFLQVQNYTWDKRVNEIKKFTI